MTAKKSQAGHGQLPEFTAEGVLPPGDYELTLGELRACLLVHGPGATQPNWDAAWRSQLVDNLAVLVAQLWQVGIDEIFVDGSFAEDKDHPNDIDGYFVCQRAQFFSGALEASLNLLDPHKCWTWAPEDRRWDPGSGKRQLPMWHLYRVELYPHYGQKSGIKDKHGHELEFPAAFRVSRRDSKPKGILKLLREQEARR